MQTVVETNAYLSAAKAAGMTDEERRHAVDTVAADPLGGDVMQGTGGCRKVRVAGRGKGKSGGYRIITVFGGTDLPVFLLAAFGKNDASNLTKAERNALARLTRILFDTYSKKVTTLRKEATR
ncbi:MAG: type II toxin-antitoxin system RelE/ParE family toxin [Bauldia sp.]|nr:type II toxin-antitoxin system RelE/ParE family toxin [Bauldia sp.]